MLAAEEEAKPSLTREVREGGKEGRELRERERESSP